MFEIRFEKLFREEIKLMRDMRVGGMIGHGSGMACSNFEQYNYDLGYIHALDRVLDTIEKVKDDMGKE